MGKKILILLMFGLIVPWSSASSRAAPRYKVSQEPIDCQIINEEAEQEYCTYKQNGQDKPFSGSQIFENNGREKLTIHYKKGFREGLMRQYDSEGHIRIEANYGRGLLNGVYKEYYENHTYSKRLVYKNGLLQGTQDLYDENGKLLGRFKYRRGILQSGYCQDSSRKHGKKQNLMYQQIKAVPFNELYDCSNAPADDAASDTETSEGLGSAQAEDIEPTEKAENE